jgi:cytochrome oxidase assembly protein ShyY1
MIICLTISDRQSDPVEFQRVALSGRFLNSQEMPVGLRTRGAAGDDPYAGGGLIGGSSKDVGYFVYTPFETKDGQRLIINRGWIPRPMKSASSRPEAQVSLYVQVVLW